MTDEFGIVIAFDMELRRPGCPIVQAALGGDTSAVSLLFDPSTWLLRATPQMKLYRISRERILRVADLVNGEHEQTTATPKLKPVQSKPVQPKPKPKTGGPGIYKLIGRVWSTPILHELCEGGEGTGADVMRRLGALASVRVVGDTFTCLAKAGLVERQEQPEGPIYRITSLGRRLRNQLVEFECWATSENIKIR